jgi:hypothetical protein
MSEFMKRFTSALPNEPVPPVINKVFPENMGLQAYEKRSIRSFYRLFNAYHGCFYIK